MTDNRREAPHIRLRRDPCISEQYYILPIVAYIPSGQMPPISPEPQPAKILIQEWFKLKTEAHENAAFLLFVALATCEASQGMVTAGEVLLVYVSHIDELEPLAREAFELKSFEKLRKTGS